jgi:hypothetical protein
MPSATPMQAGKGMRAIAISPKFENTDRWRTLPTAPFQIENAIIDPQTIGTIGLDVEELLRDYRSDKAMGTGNGG